MKLDAPAVIGLILWVLIVLVAIASRPHDWFSGTIAFVAIMGLSWLAWFGPGTRPEPQPEEEDLEGRE